MLALYLPDCARDQTQGVVSKAGLLPGRLTLLREDAAMAVRGTVRFVLFFATMLAVASCGTQTMLDASWLAPQTQPAPLGKIAVIAVLKDPSASREFEIAASDRLARAGVQAVPGFSILGNDTKLSQAEMEQRVRGSGADGVMIFKMIAVDTTRAYVPPTSYAIPDLAYGSWWDDPYWGYYYPYPYHYWGYWYPAMQVVYTPGYWALEATYRVETALYRTSDSRLVWTATSSTYNPTGDYDLAASLMSAILPELKKDDLVITGRHARNYRH